jgi:WD40 repeat protein/mono/diheme cytochrome c family protein
MPHPSRRRAIALSLFGAFFCATASAQEAAKPVSFSKDIVPILTASCTGCHQPEKLKAGLDLSTHKAALVGAKDGPAIIPGDPDKSPLVLAIIPEAPGEPPAMPEKGDPLTAQQVDLIKRWIKEGAKDDSPAVAAAAGGAAEPGPAPVAKPPVYAAPPVITSLAYSPDGSALAVTGYYEVLLHQPDGTGLIARLLSGSPRIEAITFSKDGKHLVTSGGAPAQFGHVQVWDVAARKQTKSYKTSRDTLFGVSLSPDNTKIAFGCADKSSRVIAFENGAQLTRLDQHTDWCLATAFTLDGKRLVTGGRDQALKYSDLALGQLIDDINNPLEAILSMARHPTQEQLVYGGDLGTPRLYKISDNQNRTAARNDTNLLRTFERQPGPVHAVAFSPDGSLVAVGSVGEVRVYQTKDGQRTATLPGHAGAIFSVAFNSAGNLLATGGYDGTVRIFSPSCEMLVHSFVPVPLGESAVTEAR